MWKTSSTEKLVVRLAEKTAWGYVQIAARCGNWEHPISCLCMWEPEKVRLQLRLHAQRPQRTPAAPAFEDHEAAGERDHSTRQQPPGHHQSDPSDQDDCPGHQARFASALIDITGEFHQVFDRAHMPAATASATIKIHRSPGNGTSTFSQSGQIIQRTAAAAMKTAPIHSRN